MADELAPFPQDPASAGSPGAARPSGPDRPGSMAVASIALAIMSWFMLGPLASVPGILVAALELRYIRRGESSPAGLTMARVGLYICIANVVLFTLLCGSMVVIWLRTMSAMEQLGPPP